MQELYDGNQWWTKNSYGMKHILSLCPTSLHTGRYLWRHNCIISYIVSSVDPKFEVYSDLPDHMAPGGGSIPPELCVTTQKPDIVILNKHEKKAPMSMSP